MSVDRVLDGTHAACLPGDWTLVCRIAIVLKMQTTQNQLIAYTRQRFTTHNIQRAVENETTDRIVLSRKPQECRRQSFIDKPTQFS